MTESRILQRSKDLLEAEMDSELIMLDTDTNSYVALNVVGSHLWKELEKPISQHDLVASVQQAFDAPDSGRVERDVESFISHLLEKGMVHVVGGP